MAYTLIEKAELAREYLKGTYLLDTTGQLLNEFFFRLEAKFDGYGEDLEFNFHTKNSLLLNEFCDYVDAAYLDYEKSALPYMVNAFEFSAEELNSFSLKLIFAKELFNAMRAALEKDNLSSTFSASIGSSDEGGSYNLSLYAWAHEPVSISFKYDEKGKIAWE